MFIPDDRFSTHPSPAADLVSPAAFPASGGNPPPATYAGGDRLSPAGPQDGAAAIDYRVQVGHVSLLVRGDSPDEAIRIARSRLCLELPRLWDVIRSMDASRFNVQQVNKAS